MKQRERERGSEAEGGEGVRLILRRSTDQVPRLTSALLMRTEPPELCAESG